MSAEPRADEKAVLLETGNRVADARTRRSITQTELAQRANCGLNGNGVSRIENGRINMRITQFFSISEALSVTPNDLCPIRLLRGTPLERYDRLNQQSRDTLKGFIDVLLGGQNDTGV